ncbi:hypothetical protein [Streptomyces scabiei]|uniref:hypothetical protein n=1 Tax=Streptomyces scabiei TaxID=1930 RepID=UPI0029B4E960|nr:hypothetical protein [Streptomyces scabiei]MDX2800124.1 hypothetical protein [Streptomyces scabiei]MDX3125373.1 hypothetical protein [Streptomyces scabiei]MDX3280144.1 hypothetical protein [Streptomyces scabiei]MDX3280164.1 hypothetical protein [Streptomyces scabiei]
MTDLPIDPNTPWLEFVPYPQQAPDACRATRHCVDHGWCHRCAPELAAVMSRVNVAIQRADPEEQHWGPLYAAVAEALRAPASAAVPAADRAAGDGCTCGGPQHETTLPSGTTYEEHRVGCALMQDDEAAADRADEATPLARRLLPPTERALPLPRRTGAPRSTAR